MQTEGRLIGTMNLANGLTVYFYDQTVGIIGDRCQVKMVVSIPIEIKREYFENTDNPGTTYDKFVSVVGNTVHFQASRLRNFIDRSEVDQILVELKGEFIRSNLDYISRPHFAPRFVWKMYREWQESVRLNQMYGHHLQQAKESG